MGQFGFFDADRRLAAITAKDMCPSTETVLVSTEEGMAHQSCVPFADRAAKCSPTPFRYG
jgi:hypothetical protein